MSLWAGTGFENATIAFRVLGEGSSTDTWGNITPTTRSIAVTAVLRVASQVETRDLLQVSQRVEPDSRALSGYCVDRLPDEILEEAIGELTWNGKPGKFVLTQINPPHGRAGELGLMLESSLGTKIVGWWTPNR